MAALRSRRCPSRSSCQNPSRTHSAHMARMKIAATAPRTVSFTYPRRFDRKEEEEPAGKLRRRDAEENRAGDAGGGRTAEAFPKRDRILPSPRGTRGRRPGV